MSALAEKLADLKKKVIFDGVVAVDVGDPTPVFPTPAQLAQQGVPTAEEIGFLLPGRGGAAWLFQEVRVGAAATTSSGQDKNQNVRSPSPSSPTATGSGVLSALLLERSIDELGSAVAALRSTERSTSSGTAATALVIAFHVRVLARLLPMELQRWICWGQEPMLAPTTTSPPATSAGSPQRVLHTLVAAIDALGFLPAYTILSSTPKKQQVADEVHPEALWQSGIGVAAQYVSANMVSYYLQQRAGASPPPDFKEIIPVVERRNDVLLLLLSLFSIPLFLTATELTEARRNSDSPLDEEQEDNLNVTPHDDALRLLDAFVSSSSATHLLGNGTTPLSHRRDFFFSLMSTVFSTAVSLPEGQGSSSTPASASPTLLRDAVEKHLQRWYWRLPLVSLFASGPNIAESYLHQIQSHEDLCVMALVVLLDYEPAAGGGGGSSSLLGQGGSVSEEVLGGKPGGRSARDASAGDLHVGKGPIMSPPDKQKNANVFRDSLAGIHRPAELSAILAGFAARLSAAFEQASSCSAGFSGGQEQQQQMPGVASDTYTSLRRLNLLLMLLWQCLLHNQKLLRHLIAPASSTRDEEQVQVVEKIRWFLLLFLLQRLALKDSAGMGDVVSSSTSAKHLVCFLLLLLSAEREFCVALAQPVAAATTRSKTSSWSLEMNKLANSSQQLLYRILDSLELGRHLIHDSGANGNNGPLTVLDVFVLTLVTELHRKLHTPDTQLLDVLLTILCNLSYYAQKLHKVTCLKLASLFERMLRVPECREMKSTASSARTSSRPTSKSSTSPIDQEVAGPEKGGHVEVHIELQGVAGVGLDDVQQQGAPSIDRASTSETSSTVLQQQHERSASSSKTSGARSAREADRPPRADVNNRPPGARPYLFRGSTNYRNFFLLVEFFVNILQYQAESNWDLLVSLLTLEGKILGLEERVERWFRQFSEAEDPEGTLTSSEEHEDYLHEQVEVDEPDGSTSTSSNTNGGSYKNRSMALWFSGWFPELPQRLYPLKQLVLAEGLKAQAAAEGGHPTPSSGTSSSDAGPPPPTSFTLVGLLPQPHKILIRCYEPNGYTRLWFTHFLYATVYSSELLTPVFGELVEHAGDQDLIVFDLTSLPLFSEAV